MLDAGCWEKTLNRSLQHRDTFSPRRNEEDEENEERKINQHSSRPSLSSLLRGEKVTVSKSIGLIWHPPSSIQHLLHSLRADSTSARVRSR
jgi:hypothetical protein